MRPVLKPALRRLWRDDTTLQLGVTARRSVVLHGATAGVLGALELLDGVRQPDDIVAEAGRSGVDGDAVRQLLATLAEAEALDDAGAHPPGASLESGPLSPETATVSLLHPRPGLAQALLLARGGRHVRIVGAGRVGAAVARLLAASGIGHVSLAAGGRVAPHDVAPGGFNEDDVGALPQEVLGRGDPSREIDLVLLTPPGAGDPDPWHTERSQTDGVPHLLLQVRELTGSVGPFVVPGRTSCLTCQHLHRVDRDPAWPLIVSQLRGHARPEDPCAATLVALVAATGAQQALGWLDAPAAPPNRRDLPDAAGATLEVTLPDWRFRRRTWPPHPQCGCLSGGAPLRLSG